MKLFIDTANLDEIRQVNDWGILDGVTTNPTLIAAEKGVDYKSRLKEICQMVKGPISAEVVGTEKEAMLKEADAFLKIADNIAIKLPTTLEGLKGLKELAGRGVKVNMTLCFQPLQALLVAKLGATFVSPFVGRLDDIEDAGMNLVRSIRTIYDNYGYKTQILAASIRSTLHLVQAAEIGADVATIPFKVFKTLMQHPLTDIGLDRFLKDWQAAQKVVRHEDV
jgi:transaldolase